jgi:mannosyl-oligosaccharide alpha-1,2-mannosidase
VHLPDEREPYLSTAVALADTCWHLYESTATGLGPERVRFELPSESQRTPLDGVDFTVEDSKYLLRPELVESLFVLWRVRTASPNPSPHHLLDFRSQAT